MVRIVILLIVSALLILADGPVLQTGQVKSYDDDGDVVPYGSIKDDGYYRAGAARSYSRDGGIVIDNTTGLEWQDKKQVQKPWVTQENYDDGNYSDTSGDTATTYCATFPHFIGKKWRLPSIQELGTLVDYSQYDPSATEGIFNFISSSYYWSSAAHVAYDIYAWIVRFDNGDLYYRTKNNSLYVRCVRGGPLAPSILSRIGEIVTDSATGLEWQDDSIVGTTKRTWTEAIDYCENTLTLGGHDDWRLPNQNELLSIVNFFWHDPALNNCKFQNYIPSSYWSSTSDAITASWAWTVGFWSGRSNDTWKHYSHYVRCVRGGQVNIPVNPAIIMYLFD